MKKTKFIAGALVLSMGLLGTGYAYWTDTLQVNANVSTGELDMNFVPVNDSQALFVQTFESEVRSVLGGKDNKHVEGTGITKNVNVEEDSITWNLSNLHPGAETTVQVRIKNEGTIPTKLDKVKTSKEIAAVEGLLFDVVTKNDANAEESRMNIAPKDLENTIKECIPAEFAVDQYIDLSITAKVVSEGEINIGENKLAKLAMTFEWEQYNAK